MFLEEFRSLVVRTAFFVTGLVVFGGCANAALVTLDFEGFSDSTILTTQYPSVTFTNAIILTSGISLNEFEFPPRSGMNVVSDNGGPMTIDFSPPITSFSGYFTYLEPLTIDGYNAADKEVASAASLFSNNLACLAGPPCSGDPGSSPNEFIEMSFTGGMSSVTITGDPAGGSFTLDDATYTTASATSVPEPLTAFLIPLGVALLVAYNQVQETAIAMKRSFIIPIAIAAILVAGGVLLMAARRDGQPNSLPATQSIQPSSTTPTVGTPVITPSIIIANTSTPVTVSVQITDPSLIPNSVNILLLNGTGTQPTILGGLPCNASGMCTAQFTFNQQAPGQIQLEASAAFRGLLRRVLSNTVMVGVWNAVSDGVSGLTFDLPPLGFPPLVASVSSTSGTLFVIHVSGVEASDNLPHPLLRLIVISNPLRQDLRTWFESNVDDASGTLLASGAFQFEQLANGPALIFVGPTPTSYQGGPFGQGYVLSEATGLIYELLESQDGQLTDFGYSASSVSAMMPSILGSIH